MKNDKFTVIPQNMQEYQMSIREADIENDLFRVAFEETIAQDKLHTLNDELLAFDYFQAGWKAAVRLLNDDKLEMTIEELESMYMSYLEAGGTGKPLSFEEWMDKR